VEIKETEEEPRGLAGLIQRAYRLGATGVQVIAASDIPVEDGLAKLCQPSLCENYGLSAGCPPHVSGPSGFRELVKGYREAVVFKIDVPSEVLFSNEREELFWLLHEIASGIEREAVRTGYRHSRAFAGGSCKRTYCQDHSKCRVVSGEGKCRNPDRARPSMSGFGINVSKLMQAAGWPANGKSGKTEPGAVSMGTLCGLVLIGPLTAHDEGERMEMK
jgi:predicted metal-binding protein